MSEKIECLYLTLKSMFVPAVYDVTCSALWHPGISRCDAAGLDLLACCSIKAVKIYTALYLLPRLLKQKSLFKGIQKTFPDVIRSSTFLTCNCFLTSAVHCVIRRILGHYRAVTVAFIPALVGGITTIGIEKYNRQEILAIYMSSLALECLYEMAVYRKLIPPIKGGEVALFAISSAVLVHFHRSKEIKINDTMHWLMKVLLSSKTKDTGPSHQKYLVTRLREYVTLKIDTVVENHSTYSKTVHCNHDVSCIANTVNAGLSGLLWGTIIQMSVRLLSSGGSIRQVLRLRHQRSEVLRASSFVAAYSAGVVGLECLLYRANVGEKYVPAIAGLLSGGTFALFPDPGGPVALYFFCRAFQCVYKKLIQDQVIPEIPYDTALLYTFSAAVTIHTGVCEPHLMRPSYTAFLNYLTDNKYEQLDRASINSIMKNVHTAL